MQIETLSDLVVDLLHGELTRRLELTPRSFAERGGVDPVGIFHAKAGFHLIGSCSSKQK